MRVQRREVPSRARRDPSPQRRELERLRVKPEREPVGGELLFDLRPERPSLNPRRARRRVHLEDAVHRAEIDRAHPREPLPDVRFDASHNAGPPAERNGSDAARAAPPEDLLELLFLARKRDHVRSTRKVAVVAADDVAVALAVRVEDPLARIARAARELRDDARRGERDVVDRRDRAERERRPVEERPDALAEGAPHVLVRELVGPAPAPEASLARHGARLAPRRHPG